MKWLLAVVMVLVCASPTSTIPLFRQKPKPLEITQSRETRTAKRSYNTGTIITLYVENKQNTETVAIWKNGQVNLSQMMCDACKLEESDHRVTVDTTGVDVHKFEGNSKLYTSRKQTSVYIKGVWSQRTMCLDTQTGYITGRVAGDVSDQDCRFNQTAFNEKEFHNKGRYTFTYHMYRNGERLYLAVEDKRLVCKTEDYIRTHKLKYFFSTAKSNTKPTSTVMTSPKSLVPDLQTCKRLVLWRNCQKSGSKTSKDCQKEKSCKQFLPQICDKKIQRLKKKCRSDKSRKKRKCRRKLLQWKKRCKSEKKHHCTTIFCFRYRKQRHRQRQKGRRGNPFDRTDG